MIAYAREYVFSRPPVIEPIPDWAFSKVTRPNGSSRGWPFAPMPGIVDPCPGTFVTGVAVVAKTVIPSAIARANGRTARAVPILPNDDHGRPEGRCRYMSSRRITMTMRTIVANTRMRVLVRVNISATEASAKGTIATVRPRIHARALQASGNNRKTEFPYWSRRRPKSNSTARALSPPAAAGRTAARITTPANASAPRRTPRTT